ncbi:MAG: hypothetical protein BZY82_03470 [SAR202 cluster bacterium Io17-Chloro-G3]|nr:MAG: hypothetical protein BZY82_03470 [SAR202 cluster bacterium Io17-Chloro-G3]
MGNRFEGKVAVITGGGRGIGRAVAHLLAEEMASLVINDLGCEADGTGYRNATADSVVEEVKQAGGKAVSSYDDVSTMEGGEAVIQKAVDTYGRIDVLVNSVGVRRDAMISQMNPEDWHVVMRNSLKSAFTTTKNACILMRQQRSGRIVNLTSDAGLGAIGMANYSAAMEGIIGMTRTVARDMGRYGVNCNAVSPVAKTRLFPGAAENHRVFGLDEPSSRRAGLGIPPPLEAWEGPGSPNDPENVAPIVVYLCSDQSPNANGYVFGVRGGSIYVYSNPAPERSIFKAGIFTMDELDELVPQFISYDLPCAWSLQDHRVLGGRNG